jgi:MFS family permease
MLARFRNLNLHTKIELILVMACTSFGFFALGSLSPILPLHLADLGINPQTIGLMFSTMGVAFAIGEIFWGWFIDRLDPKIALVCGTFLLSLAIGSFLVWKDPAYFFISFFIFGLFMGPAFVLGRWYLGVKAPIAEKAVSMALLMGMISAVFSIAGFSSGFIGDSIGYRFVILIAAILPMILGLILVTQLRKLHFNFPSHQQDQSVSQAGGIELRWRLSIVIAIGGISAIQMTTFGINNAFMALYTTTTTGVNASGVGILFGLTGLIRLLVVIPIGRFADRRGKRHFVSIGLAGMIAAYLGVAVSQTYAALLVSVLSFSLFSAMMSVLMAMLSERVPQEKQGLAMGILGFSEDGGLIVGSGLGGFFWNALGPRGPFLFGSGMLGACLVLWFLLLRSGLLGGEFSAQERPGYP